jgi:hypothetical protein
VTRSIISRGQGPNADPFVCPVAESDEWLHAFVQVVERGGVCGTMTKQMKTQ